MKSSKIIVLIPTLLFLIGCTATAVTTTDQPTPPTVIIIPSGQDKVLIETPVNTK